LLEGLVGSLRHGEDVVTTLIGKVEEVAAEASGLLSADVDHLVVEGVLRVRSEFHLNSLSLFGILNDVQTYNGVLGKKGHHAVSVIEQGTLACLIVVIRGEGDGSVRNEGESVEFL